MMNPVELTVQPLSQQAFSRYGDVIAADASALRAINAGTSLRSEQAGRLQLTAEQGEPVLAVFSASPQALSGPWQVLERHLLGSQSFIPLGGARCVVLVALGEVSPELATLAAFYVDGSTGFTFNPGTWHHPLIALDKADFVVLERRGQMEDCEVVKLPVPVLLRQNPED